MNQNPLPAPQFSTRDLTTLEDEITELSAHLNAATYRLLTLIREFDEREGWSGPGMKSCAHWLNWKCGIDLGAAREKVRVAHALDALPNISSALRAGQISFSKVRAMTRVATPQNEDYLLMIANHGTAAHVERLVHKYRQVKRCEALERENARIAQALKMAMESENVSAETSFHRETTGHEETPIAALRADALERIADHFLTSDENTVTGGDRCTLHIHTDMNTLKADGEGAESELTEGGNVSAETSRRLACDCGVVHWLEEKSGTALDIGRRTRSIPPSIRRALERRDGGCRFPGCTARHYVDAHHIHHWADGGETKLDNLLLLCRHHHRLVHEGGYGLAMPVGGEPIFTAPNGRLIPGGPDTRFRGNVFALTTSHQRENIEIGPGTIVPQWHGDRMDDAMAVEGLIRRE